MTWVLPHLLVRAATISSWFKSESCLDGFFFRVPSRSHLAAQTRTFSTMLLERIRFLVY
jgi:hypothetical protein